ncbi:MAG: hypothetical protein QNJ16_19630 [Rhodobacter sp.]|nr:hypothetical protein [Rhodobacter sp.]
MAEHILVIGGGSALGCEIARVLAGLGHRVMGTYRSDRLGVIAAIAETGAEPMQLDLSDEVALKSSLAAADGAVFVPKLTQTVAAGRFLAPGQPAVFFSSNNVVVDRETPNYRNLAAAEETLRQAAPEARVLRPTMIYGHAGDRNLSRLMRSMRRRRVVFRPATSALQQPIFFRDVARICAELLFEPGRSGATMAAGGPDEVTYRQLYAAVAQAAGARCLSLPVPVGAALAGARLLRATGAKVPVRMDQLRRARFDKRARGAEVRLGTTSLQDGLQHLAAALEHADRN